MAEWEPPKESRPGGWSFRARIDYRGPFDFDASFDDEVIDFLEKRLKPPLGRPPSDRKWRWIRSFYTLKVEYDELYECHHADGERPPNKMGICEGVAYRDFEEHPGDWDYNPNEFPVRAKHKVWDAIKDLLARDEIVLIRAARGPEYIAPSSLKPLT
jgi:hypothetical protein